MRCELPGEGQVAEPGNSRHGLVNAVALEPAVPQDHPDFQPRQGVYDAGSCPAVDGILRFPVRAEA